MRTKKENFYWFQQLQRKHPDLAHRAEELNKKDNFTMSIVGLQEFDEEWVSNRGDSWASERLDAMKIMHPELAARAIELNERDGFVMTPEPEFIRGKIFDKEIEDNHAILRERIFAEFEEFKKNNPHL